MKIAITGATGLIGTALSASLGADGHEVVPLVRRPVRSDEAAVQWDPADDTLDPGALVGVDAVVNLAGAGVGDKRWNDEYKRLVLESRTSSTALISRTIAGLDEPPKVLVSGSAMGIYGDTGDEAVTETSPHGHDFLAGVCEAWEAATAPAEEAGIRVAHLRTGMVLANPGGALGKMLPLFKLGAGGRMGSGRQWWSWISIDDEVGLIRWLIDGEVRGPVNATSPQPATNADFTRVLGEVLHRPTIVPVPSFGPKLLLGGELADTLLFTSQKVLPQVALDGGYAFRYPVLEAALRHVLDRPAAA